MAKKRKDVNRSRIEEGDVINTAGVAAGIATPLYGVRSPITNELVETDSWLAPPRVYILGAGALIGTYFLFRRYGG
jgi:hypothetical protein